MSLTIPGSMFADGRIMRVKDQLCVVGAVCLIVGAAIGSVSTYILTKKKFEREAEEEIEQIREWYSKRFAKNRGAVEDVKTKELIDDKSYWETLTKTGLTDYTQYSSIETTVTSGDISKMKDELDRLNKEVHQDDELDEHMAEREHPEDDEEETAYLENLAANEAIAAEKAEAVAEGRAAYFIELRDFSNEKLWYEKLTWTYYKPDDILADERDLKVDPADRALCVPDNLASYFEAKDVVYFRNDARQTDVEVCVMNDHYEEPPEARGPSVTIIS